MNLNIQNQLFVVSGASSGFGKAVAENLAKDGGKIIAIARGAERLEAFQANYPHQIEAIVGDITQTDTLQTVLKTIGERKLSGILINAGGPPSKSFLETQLNDWDDAYQNILRWKVEAIKTFLPLFLKEKYGRVLFVESASVKQPIENLVLSTSLRLAVVGMAKTISEEVASQGITVNVLAPSYHATPAMERLFTKRSEAQQISVQEARQEFESEIKIGELGNPSDFGELGAWLLSPQSRFITGQTISIDGGVIKGIMG